MPLRRPDDIPGVDYERKVIDFARRILDDIPECREADYAVRWSRNTATGDTFPFLTIAFHLPQTIHQPALGIGLVTVRKGTLLEVLPGKTLHEGDKLRDHILFSVDAYLNKHGIRLSLDPDEAMRLLRAG